MYRVSNGLYSLHQGVLKNRRVDVIHCHLVYGWNLHASTNLPNVLKLNYTGIWRSIVKTNVLTVRQLSIGNW